MILIVTEEYAPSVDKVEAILRLHDKPHFRFNTEEYPLSTCLMIEPNPDHVNGFLKVHGQKIELRDIHAVWFRHRGEYRLTPGLSAAEKDIVREECDLALNGLWASLHCFSVNNPFRERLCNYKPLQLKIAQQVGLAVPRTLITNNADQVRSFWDQHNRQVVMKTLGQPVLIEDESETTTPSHPPVKFIYTNLLKEEHFAKLSSLQGAPMIFQEYIPKKFELRITVVGNDIFPAEIHSQEAPEEKTRVDWRHYDLEHTPHLPHNLPPDISEKLLKFMKACGLVFGCIDMVVTPDNEYVFLEINPAGQYGWIELLVGFPITQAIAEMLIRGRAEK